MATRKPKTQAQVETKAPVETKTPTMYERTGIFGPEALAHLEAIDQSIDALANLADEMPFRATEMKQVFRDKLVASRRKVLLESGSGRREQLLAAKKAKLMKDLALIEAKLEKVGK